MSEAKDLRRFLKDHGFYRIDERGRSHERWTDGKAIVTMSRGRKMYYRRMRQVMVDVKKAVAARETKREGIHHAV